MRRRDESVKGLCTERDTMRTDMIEGTVIEMEDGHETSTRDQIVVTT